MPALLLLTGPSAGLRVEIALELTIGRSPSCELPLEDGKVSRRHAKIVLREGQAHVTDLGSRNGTVVNGEKIEGEAVLLPGDRMQVGDSTMLYEPPAKVSLSDDSPGEGKSTPVEEVLPAFGPEATLYSAGMALLTATSEAMLLRRTAEELARGVSAERTSALLGGVEGLMTASVVGDAAVEVPRGMARAALERKEASWSDNVLCAPLTASGGAPFGLLYAERGHAFGPEEQRVAAVLGRLAGEALAAFRARADRAAPQVALVGSARPFRRVVEQARRAAAGQGAVVFFGEAGTGRCTAASYVHSRSERALGPFIVVDCRAAALSVEEELFGRQSAPGQPPLSSALLRADGGTLVLRHLEALPRATGERLSRFLGQKTAPARQGGEEPVNVRVIVTASSSVALTAAKGDLDAELARVLAGAEIEMPPLRDRRPDVAVLFDHFAARRLRNLRKGPPSLAPETRRLLSEYTWPGNVRELQWVSERLAWLYAGTEISPLQLPPEIQAGTAEPQTKTLQELVARLERDAISQALREARGKKIRAAALLGISRPTLDKKIEDYQLVVEKQRGPA